MIAWTFFHRFCSLSLDALLPDLVLPLPFLMGPLKGMLMKISLKSERQFIYGNFEVEVVKMIQDVIKPGWVIYDVGAHVGYFTLIFSRLVGPKGHCFSFEPSPKVFRRLKSNVQLNRRRLQAEVDAIEIGLYSEAGQKEFFIGGSSSTGRLVRFPKEVPEETIVTVPVTTIDTLVGNGMPSPDIVKIDVEYVEDHVIRGAINTISNHQTIILCEIHTIESGTNCFNILKSLSYDIRHIETTHAWNSTDSVSTGHIIAFPEGSQHKR